MENKFWVTNWRPDLKNKRIIHIKGIFKEKETSENELLVCVDKKKLKFTMEKITGVISAEQCLKMEEIPVEYYIKAVLPENYQQYENIQVFNFYKGVGGEAFSLPVKKFIKRQNKVEKFIEEGKNTEKGIWFKGWYIATEDTKMTVYDGKKPLKIEVQYRRRPDVLKQYPECAEEEIVGFEALCKNVSAKKVRIVLQSKAKKSEYVLNLQSSTVVKVIKKSEEMAIKGVAFYRQFGLQKALIRTYEKLTHQDTTTYDVWRRKYWSNMRDLRQQRKETFSYMPKFSIVVPLYKTPEKYLDEMIDSVRKQSYANWELCLSDGSGKNSPLTAVLKKYEQKDHRIKVIYNNEQLQISDNTNRALDAATGDFIVFGDHDDLLAPDALYQCVKVLNEERGIDVIYTDEDKVTMDGKEYYQPHFKSDFNIDLLRSMNYICHLFVVKRSLYEKVGNLRSEFDGAQDYDFVLRCAEQAEKIKHIPKILYHWRAHKDSTAENPESKAYAFEAGVRAIQAHYERLGIEAKVEQVEMHGAYRTVYGLKEEPLVSVVIPNKDHTEDLDKCIRSLEEISDYKNIEYVIIENNSELPETFAYYEKLQKENSKVKVVYWEREFNYSAINNFGVKSANGEYLLFLNNDTEIINPDCVRELLSYCMRPEVGIVGARLYYEDDTIQHAGVIVGLGGIAGHAFVGEAKESVGYFSRIICAQDLSAVTAACMMVKKSVFEEVEGFEEKLAVAFNDVDFCLKVRKAGYLVVYNPYAELHHYESKSRGLEDTEEKVRRFQGEIMTFATRWKEFLKEGDPYYSPNLTLERNDFSLRV